MIIAAMSKSIISSMRNPDNEDHGSQHSDKKANSQAHLRVIQDDEQNQ